MGFQVTEDSKMTLEEMKKLIIKFEDFLCQKTFHETEIHVRVLRAYDYYMACHKEDCREGGVPFANFVAGYLSAELDAKRNSH
jgi:hypothetical protein